MADNEKKVIRPCECGADRCTGFKDSEPGQLGEHVVPGEHFTRGRNTKVLRGTFEVVFHGDYVAAEDCMQYLDSYMDSGLDDRDDLRSWEFKLASLTQIEGDPEGFDL
jgi:hypothetical protein